MSDVTDPVGEPTVDDQLKAALSDAPPAVVEGAVAPTEQQQKPPELTPKQQLFLNRKRAVQEERRRRQLKNMLKTLRNPITVAPALRIKPVVVRALQDSVIELLRAPNKSKAICVSVSPRNAAGLSLFRYHSELPKMGEDKIYTSGTQETPTFEDIDMILVEGAGDDFPGAVVLRDRTTAAGDPKKFFAQVLQSRVLSELKKASNRSIGRKYGMR